MGRILLTGCSIAEVPLIKALQKNGHYVITFGKNKNGLAHNYSNECVYGDYSNGEQIYEAIKKHKIDNIVSGCNDFAYIATSYAAEKAGIVGHEKYENACTIHNKDLFKKVAHKYGAYVPRNIICNKTNEIHDICNKLGFPLIVKPVDLASGCGIKKCNNKEETIKAVKEAFKVTRQDRVIIEEFIVGDNHACSMFVKNNKVVFYFVDAEQYHINRYMVAGAYSLHNYSYSIVEKIIKPIENIFEHLCLVDGLFHVQFIEKDNFPYIIDVCRRTPGELYGLLVSDSTGIDYYDIITKFEMAQNVPNEMLIKTKKEYIARECVMDNKVGKYIDTNIPEFINEHIYSKFDVHSKGELIEDPLSFKSQIIMLRFDNEDDLIDKCNNFHKNVKIIVE